MKVTVEVDLTPKEARELVGLPDVQPLQNAAMAEIQERVIAQARNLSAEELIKRWFSGEGAGSLANMFGDLLSLGRGKEKRSASSKGEASQ